MGSRYVYIIAAVGCKVNGCLTHECAHAIWELLDTVSPHNPTGLYISLDIPTLISTKKLQHTISSTATRLHGGDYNRDWMRLNDSGKVQYTLEIRNVARKVFELNIV